MKSRQTAKSLTRFLSSLIKRSTPWIKTWKSLIYSTLRFWRWRLIVIRKRYRIAQYTSISSIISLPIQVKNWLGAGLSTRKFNSALFWVRTWKDSWKLLMAAALEFFMKEKEIPLIRLSLTWLAGETKSSFPTFHISLYPWQAYHRCFHQTLTKCSTLITTKRV